LCSVSTLLRGNNPKPKVTMKNTLFITVVSLLAFMAQAQQGPQFDYEKMKEVSTAYFDAYSKLDAKKMVSFYHDDIEYHDQTYAGYGGQPLIMKGFPCG